MASSAEVKPDGATFFRIPLRDIRITFLCYLVAHGGILLIPNAVYWDDWGLWNTTPAIVLDEFRQLGSPFNFHGHIHVAMLAAGPWAYRVLTFLLMYATGLLLYRILEIQKWIRNEDRLLIVTLFLISPFYAARIALIDFPYTVCLFLFFLGWYFIGRNRVASLACFVLSFCMESLLVFYLLPMLDYYFRERRSGRPSELIAWGFRKLDFMAAPFIWFAAKGRFFKPFGVHEGYNEDLGTVHLLKAPLMQVWDLLTLSGPVCFGFIAIIIAVTTLRRLGTDMGVLADRTLRNRYFLIGLVALVAGVFPYWILGRVPAFSDWNSRHQILMPLGAAFLFLGFLACWEERSKAAFLSVYAGIFLALNWGNYTSLFLDWQKQKAIVRFLKQSKDVAAANLIVFEDTTPNAFSRIYRFYEWDGLLKLAYSGRSDKFGVNEDQLDQYLRGDFDREFSVHFNAENHRRNDPETIVGVMIKGNILKQTISTVIPTTSRPAKNADQ
jgi:hypothetical protein